MGFSEQSLVEKYPFESEYCVLVDVGAHHGSFSTAFAKKDWRVIAFEPERKNRVNFERNLAGYDKVSCLPLAVSDRSGEKVPFYVSKEYFGIHSLKPFHETHEAAYEVETTCLKDALQQFELPEVTLLKVDTEGADFLALKGFDFERYHPEVVLVEYMDERSSANFNYTHHDMVAYMAAYGYAAFVSEWAPIKEYAREGVVSDPHTWLRCAPYPLDHEPAWGNLVFVKHLDVDKFRAVLESYLSHVVQGRALTFADLVRKIPGAVWLYRKLFAR